MQNYIIISKYGKQKRRKYQKRKEWKNCETNSSTLT